MYAKYDQIANQNAWNQAHTLQGEYRSLPSEYEKRHIFTTYLQNLETESEYAFKIYTSSSKNDPQIYTFKPLDYNNITMVIGGDLGINECTFSINNPVKEMRADLFMVGGDFSYDNAFPE